MESNETRELERESAAEGGWKGRARIDAFVLGNSVDCLGVPKEEPTTESASEVISVIQEETRWWPEGGQGILMFAVVLSLSRFIRASLWRPIIRLSQHLQMTTETN